MKNKLTLAMFILISLAVTTPALATGSKTVDPAWYMFFVNLF